MIKNILLLVFCAICLSSIAQTPKFKLVTTQLSRGGTPSREYIQFVVAAKQNCSELTGGDSIANISNYVINDPNAYKAYSINGINYPGIASGKYRFPKTPAFDSIAYGSIILVYNNLAKNTNIQYVDDSTGKTKPHVYVIPVSWLDSSFDPLTAPPPPDSILSTPASLNLKEGQNCFLNTPIFPTDNVTLPPPYINSATNWTVDDITDTRSTEAPGATNVTKVRNWFLGFQKIAVVPFKASIYAVPNSVDGYACSNNAFQLSGTISLPFNTMKDYKWLVNNIWDSLNGSVSNDTILLNRTFNRFDSVTLSVTTTLKCIINHDSVAISKFVANYVVQSRKINTLITTIPPALVGTDSLATMIDTSGLSIPDSSITYRTYCKGTTVTFIPKPTDSSRTDLFLWYKNGLLVASDSTYTDSTLKNKDSIQCVLQTGVTCALHKVVTTTIRITILDSIAPPKIIISGDTSLCSGVNATFNARLSPTSIGDSTARYTINWTVNDNPLGRTFIYVDSANKGTDIVIIAGDTVYRNNVIDYTSNVFITGDVLKATLITIKSNSCPIIDTTFSNALTMFVTQTVTPTIALTTTQNGLCPTGFKDTILFAATSDPLSTGTAPKYQWRINEIDVKDSTQLTYTNYGTLNNGDSVSIKLINTTYKCLNPDSAVAVIVLNTFNPLPTPGAIVNPNPPTVCSGNLAPVVFTASGFVNQGLHPTYQWFVNAKEVTDPLNPTVYNYNNIADKDVLSFTLTSGVACAQPKDTTVTIPISITTTVTPSVSIIAPSDTAICFNPNGYTFQLNATVVNGGAFTLDWLVDGVIVQQGRTDLQATFSSLNDGDIITCVLHSGANCLTNKDATSNSVTVKINPLPVVDPISGDVTVCMGSFKTLTETTVGGKWSSTGTDIAVIDSLSGKITGVSPGNANIFYSVTDINGCTGSNSLLYSVTPSNIPEIVANRTNICKGDTTQLSVDLSLASGTSYWLSKDNTIASVDIVTGIVTGINNGQVVIYDSVINDCGTTLKSININVGPPVVANTKGPKEICSIAGAITLTNDTTGGVWSAAGFESVATVDPNKGVVTAVSAGLATISYTVTNNCGSTTKNYTITVGKPVVDAITGSTIVCVNKTSPFNNTTPNGVWSVTPTNLATIDTNGVVTGKAEGSATVQYKVTSAACGDSTALFSLTIAKAQAKQEIVGDSLVCIGNTTQLTHPQAGGQWSSSNKLIANVDPNGLVTGVNNGLITIKYIAQYSCGSDTLYHEMVVGNPIRGAYTFSSPICVGDTSILKNDSKGATSVSWGSDQPGIATVSDPIKGILIGKAGGVAPIVLYLSNSCLGSSSISFKDIKVTVNALPVVAAIAGKNAICAKDTAIFTNGTTRGTWGTGDTTIAKVDAKGDITPVATGTATITYKVTTNGCSYTVNKPITINSLPTVASITGSTSVCNGRIITLADVTGGGIWKSDNTATAVIDNSGNVLGKATGTATIKYTVTDANSCTDSVSASIKVNAIPSIGTITGGNSVCVDKTLTLSNSVATGVWSTTNANLATVVGGVVTGVDVGIDTIKYTVTENGCDTAVIQPVTITKPIVLPITAIDSFNVHKGLQIHLADATVTGGVWSSLNTTIATIEPNGTVTGLFPGAVTIKFTTTVAGCLASAQANVVVLNPLNDIYVPNFLYPNSLVPNPNPNATVPYPNRYFMVHGQDIAKLDFKIFSQWGELMYSTTEPKANGWDGIFKGKEQPVGVYVYVVSIVLNNGESIVKKGSVNLIR